MRTLFIVMYLFVYSALSSEPNDTHLEKIHLVSSAELHEYNSKSNGGDSVIAVGLLKLSSRDTFIFLTFDGLTSSSLNDGRYSFVHYELSNVGDILNKSEVTKISKNHYIFSSRSTLSSPGPKKNLFKVTGDVQFKDESYYSKARFDIKYQEKWGNEIQKEINVSNINSEIAKKILNSNTLINFESE